MIEAAENTMKLTKGPLFRAALGISAPQIGYHKRFIIFDEFVDNQEELITTIALNPKIISISQTVQTLEEGCLSIPW